GSNAIPARLFSRIRDQVEDRRWASRDLAAGADHPRRLLISCHALIQASGQPCDPAVRRRPDRSAGAAFPRRPGGAWRRTWSAAGGSAARLPAHGAALPPLSTWRARSIYRGKDGLRGYAAQIEVSCGTRG